MHPLAAALLLFQSQGPFTTSPTTPPSRDTTGYWQQRVRYDIVATLDESHAALRARATLRYVNNSPDTLRELYFHQYLNAFRPGSKWSAADAREGRIRFQNLREPAYAYERFTETPTFDDTPVAPQYPGEGDSTVVRFALPRPLAPGDSLRAVFSWEARPSTTPRRQGRRGRSYDFAQWYPKVAVYDRAGWQARVLVPAGEFYGEFGEYDVTLLVRGDQVIGATGVPVEGDPGWRGALRWGAVHGTADAYGDTPPVTGDSVPAGYKRVRFLARDVHHFAWSASPDYRYEGGVYVRPAGASAVRFPSWDSVAVHVLYKPGDEREWGGGVAVARTQRALRWLEHMYGKYGYPQMTNLHRLDAGGTEFPMMMMNGSASQGLILHEGGHIFSYGMLANNEWRSGWMDEGLTEYQTDWALGSTRHDRASRVTPFDSLLAADSGGASASRPPTRPRPTGYRGLAVRPAPEDATALQQYRYDLLGRAEPIGTIADWFNEFGIYNAMIYDRAAMMYDALRDVLGETAFRDFLRDYYARWAFRHVDETAMRASAERASGRDLGWFFEWWVHRTGLVDYALRSARVRRDGGTWLTRARVVRVGDYPHPVPVGVRTADGWTVVRPDEPADERWVEVRTAGRPREVRLDPYRATPDWYRPNDSAPTGAPGGAAARVVLDWPFLDQSLADRTLIAVTPLAWYGKPGGPTAGGRARSNYQGLVNRYEVGLAVSARLPGPTCFPTDGSRPSCSYVSPQLSRWQAWLAVANPILPAMGGRPIVGLSAGAWRLDGITKVDVRRSWELSRYLLARGSRTAATVAFTGTYPYDMQFADPRRWSGLSASEGSVGYALRTPDPLLRTLRASVAGGYLAGKPLHSESRHYERAEAEGTVTRRSASGRFTSRARLFAALTNQAPLERAVYLSALNPTETFTNHLVRPAGAPLAREDVNYTPLGGAGMRGYSPLVPVERVASLNLEQELLLRAFGPASRPLRVSATVFGDAAVADLAELGGRRGLGDAGVGLALRGAIFDREVRTRVDVPIFVSRPELGVSGDARAALRVTFSFADLW